MSRCCPCDPYGTGKVMNCNYPSCGNILHKSLAPSRPLTQSRTEGLVEVDPTEISELLAALNQLRATAVDVLPALMSRLTVLGGVERAAERVAAWKEPAVVSSGSGGDRYNSEWVADMDALRAALDARGKK